LLLKHGAKIDAEDYQGQTPLFFTYYTDMVDCLIESSANVNHRDKEEHTPLMNMKVKGTIDRMKEAGAE
jgi:ankyrin repeat protein